MQLTDSIDLADELQDSKLDIDIYGTGCEHINRDQAIRTIKHLTDLFGIHTEISRSDLGVVLVQNKITGEKFFAREVPMGGRRPAEAELRSIVNQVQP